MLRWLLSRQLRTFAVLVLRKLRNLLNLLLRLSKEGLPKAEAEEIKAKLEEAGAKIELK